MHSHESLPRAGALAWFARAAACGDAYAQFNLGMMYKDGDGAPPRAAGNSVAEHRHFLPTGSGSACPRAVHAPGGGPGLVLHGYRGCA